MKRDKTIYPTLKTPAAPVIILHWLCLCNLVKGGSGEEAVLVETGTQLARALASSAITRIQLTNDIVLRKEDFPDNSVVYLERNITVEGASFNGFNLGTTLDLNFVKRKVRLGAAVTWTFRYLTLVDFREGSITAAPGIDLLSPASSPSDGTRSRSLVYVQDAMLLLRWCYPPSTQKTNLRSFVRPSSLPGLQNVSTQLPQPGCVNSSEAPLSQRCWATYGMYNDLAVESVDMDISGLPVPNNYVVWLVRVKFGCVRVMSEDCVDRFGPVGCLFVMMQAGPLGAEEVVPWSFNGDSPAAARGGGGGGGGGGGVEGGLEAGAVAPPSSSSDSNKGLLVPVLVGVLGGVVVLAAVVGILLWHRGLGPRRGGPAGATKLDLYQPRSAASRRPRGSPHGLKEEEVWVAPIGRLIDCEEAGSPSDGLTVGDPGEERRLETGHGTAPLELHVVVTPLTPTRPDLAMGVECGNEVTLLPVVRGKGSFGRVQEGLYGGQRVAVKLLPCDVLSGEVGPETAGAAPGEDAAAAAVPEGVEGLAAGAGARVCDVGRSQVEGVVGVMGDQQLDETPQNAAAAAASGAAAAEPVDPGGGGGGKGACGRRELETFVQEVEVLGRCQHPNVVRLLAACLGPPQPCLVMELMETSLDKILHVRPAELLQLTTVLHIAIGVARGLEYLHPTIVHRDLKPANVLVNMSGLQLVAKLSDFGLARMRNTVLATRHPEAGTPAYMAPECFDTQNLRITHQADIYSFAVILWEMLTGLLPWWGCAPVAIAYTVTLLGERLPLDSIPADRCPPKLACLMTQCFDGEPRRRPAAAELVKELQMLLQTVEAEGSCRPGRSGASRIATPACCET